MRPASLRPMYCRAADRVVLRMSEPKICRTCEFLYWRLGDRICLNHDSECGGDWVDLESGCDDWEGIE